MKTGMKPQPRTAYSINREGKLVQANGFKKPEPTISMNNYGIWGHSIERTDSANPITGFIILGVTLVIMGIIVKLLG